MDIGVTISETARAFAILTCNTDRTEIRDVQDPEVLSPYRKPASTGFDRIFNICPERTFFSKKVRLPGNSANMATMNAYGWVKHGGAETMKLLTVPRPTTPGPGEVLIKLKVGPHV
jgi:hypothetical protein